LTAPLPLRTALRDAWRIAAPYFRSDERWIGYGLLAALVGAQLVIVGAAVAENYWRNAFFQTLQDRNWPGFLQQFWVYAVIAIFHIGGAVYQRYMTQWLTIRWRRWLTQHYLDRWLDGSTHYRAMLAPDAIDNPDQRIAEDIRAFIETTLDLLSGLIGAIARLLSFVAILWSLSNLIPFTVFGVAIPGYLVWAALIYAIVGSVVTHWIGRSLITIDYEQERREADFRFALVRLRENSEAIALLRGEQSEKNDLTTRFQAILGNWYRLMTRQQFVGLFAESYKRYSLYFPYFVMAPLFFGGNMQLGAFMQSGSAFNEVRNAFSYFIVSYVKIAELSAVVQRLSQFDAIVTRTHAGPEPVEASAGSLQANGIVIRAPSGSEIISLEDIRIEAGDSLLIRGRSGIGKTSLLRTLSGIWPYFEGRITLPSTRVLVLPQRPYMPLGSLRKALLYPGDWAPAADANIVEALELVGLETLIPELDQVIRWDGRLSEGEKQRLSIARALVLKPDVLILDEATSALGEALEVSLHRLVREQLRDATVIAVSHSDALVKEYARTLPIDLID
jgi:vitamin B12/bleomycin/antimicrobial peptide transport system ATP-binding/permease protein